MNAPRWRAGRRLLRFGIVTLLVLGGGFLVVEGWRALFVVPTPSPPVFREATSEQVHSFCAACHTYPPPDSFPRSAWFDEVMRGYQFAAASPELLRAAPSPGSVLLYYEARAPEALARVSPLISFLPPPVSFARTGHRLPGSGVGPVVTNVSLARLSGTPGAALDVLVCDLRSNRVLAFRPSAPAAGGGPDPKAGWRELAAMPFPAHAEAADLDGDGIQDVLVANLGAFDPTDDLVGSVAWLRGRLDGTFSPVTLLNDVGRVADVQAADLNKDGRLDLVVAAFGWRSTGEVLWLENRTTDWSRPTFVPHVLDERHGAIHVPVADLNGDGWPDFVAAISQEHETVVAFLNEKNGRFRKETVFTGPHPAFGCSGIQLADLDGDRDVDVLLTNGDILDMPVRLKPYHGIHWLENRGTFPFTPRLLGAMDGVMRAVAADFDGDGDLDVAAVAYVPEGHVDGRDGLDAVVLLEQTRPGRFIRHVLQKGACDHLTCVAADLGGGRPGLVIGHGDFVSEARTLDGLTLWKNQGRPPQPGAGGAKGHGEARPAR